MSPSCYNVRAWSPLWRCVIGAVAGLLGIGGGGSDFQAETAKIINPFTYQPTADAQRQSQQATNLVTGTAQQLAPSSALGLQRQNEQYGAMQQLANQLGLQAQGQGPNPALAQLANTTGQNIAGTTAAMASARGASANPGLIARQAAQQGAATTQQAVGQAAVLSAQQQLAAQQALQQQQAQQTALANQQVGQGISAANAGADAAQRQNTLTQQQLANFNAQNLANVQQQNAANAGVQAEAAKGTPGLIGGLVGGIGSAIGLADGGVVPGPMQRADQAVPAYVGDKVLPLRDPSSPEALKALADAEEESRRFQEVLMKGSPHNPKGEYAAGGRVDAMVSPGEKYLPPSEAKAVAKGADPMKKGQTIKGKAAVPGDSYANDTVAKKLTAGGVVIPRSVMQSKDPAGNAAKFVAAVLAKKRSKR